MAAMVRKNERGEMRRALVMTCQVVREKDFRIVAEKALDVSPDGMLLSTDVDLDIGENVFVSFRATGLGIWFDAEAKVTRLVRGRRPGDKGKGIAIRFSNLPPVKRLILRGHLRRVPPPVPRRTQRIDWTATVRGLQS